MAGAVCNKTTWTTTRHEIAHYPNAHRFKTVKKEVSSCQAKKDARRGNSSVPAANAGQTSKARKSGAKTPRISPYAEAKHQDEANQHYLTR